jgi:hypothetical protein
MRLLGLLGILGLVFGCSGQPAPVAAQAPTVALPAEAESEPTTSAAEAPEPSNEIVEPTNVACRIVEKAWNQSKLHLRANAPSFGSLYAAPSTLLLPTGDKPTEAIAVIDDGNILLRAVILDEEVRFFMPKPTALLGLVTPESDTALSWVSTKPDTVRVGIEVEELLTPDPFEADLSCANVGLVESEYDARASITKQKKLQKRLTARDDVEIFATQKGRASGTLKGGIEVELLATKGADARILIEGHGYFVSGWVARKDLVTGVGVLGAGYGRGAGYGSGAGRLSNMLSCPSDVDLYVEQGTDRMKVGLLHKGALFYLQDEEAQAKFVAFRVPATNWLSMDKSARLVLEAASIQSCITDRKS